jgi:hypothetical protein
MTKLLIPELQKRGEIETIPFGSWLIVDPDYYEMYI